MIRSRQNQQRHKSSALVAGLLALFLQMLAPALPGNAMASAMTLAATTPEEAASFAATCLGFGRPDQGHQPPADHQTKCPICLSLAQAQGHLPVPAPLVGSIAWTRADQPAIAISVPGGVAARAFASRAPPAA